jgi:hypothetical protein
MPPDVDLSDLLAHGWRPWDDDVRWWTHPDRPGRVYLLALALTLVESDDHDP